MNVAFIPVRGGSKSIPLKNIKNLMGKPLVYWVTIAANDCNYIDKVYVATDSERIKDIVLGFELSKVEVIGRSNYSASDTAPTESALLEFADNYEFDNIFLIQATSPLLTCYDLNGGYELYKTDGTNSVLSVVRQKRFCWRINSIGEAKPINYDVFKRPRRQDFEGYLVENGAFYITSRSALINSRNRISGVIRTYEMPEESYIEIDEPSDWKIIESIMARRYNIERELFNKDIKLVLTDCDGCLTDGGMYYSEKGDEIKKFNTKDGVAFKLLKERGIMTGIITGEKVELNKRRAAKVGTDFYEDGCFDKLNTVKHICKINNIKLENVLYIGDDINDLELLKAVGLSCAPADASDEVKEVVDYQARTKGGCGVLREIAELLL